MSEGWDKSRAPLLSVQEVSVGFRHRDGSLTEVVRDVSFEITPGTSLAIVGESGSGKTVSMRAILGLLPKTAVVRGRAQFQGTDLLAMPARDLSRLRGRAIGMVFQNAMQALNPTLTLKHQLTEPLIRHGICSRAEAVRRAMSALDRVGIPQPSRRIKQYPFQLSGGMRQRAMIAMAIIAEPALLIADEPTTAVDVTLQRQVLDLLADLRSEGMSMIMITHDLGVARYSCEEIVVMREGVIVERGKLASVIQQPQTDYTKRLLTAAVDLERVEEPADAASSRGEPRAEVLGLTRDFHSRAGRIRALDNVSLTIGAGETVGVVGESGSGKSTLGRLLLGLITPTAGTVRIEGEDILAAKGERLRNVRRRAQIVFQNPYGSLLPHKTAAANVMEPLRVHRIGDKRERRQRALELLELVGIPPDRVDNYPRQFSGGQQQRIALARALALEPSLLVCDEPTSSLDVSVQAQILQLLIELKERLDISILFITHNLAVARRVSDRIVVMSNGCIVESAPTRDLFEHPRHPYTRSLLGAVLPVTSAPRASEPEVGSTTLGELIEVTPSHWVRTRPEAVALAATVPMINDKSARRAE